jgi:ribulose-5-phosphate 4-epimerase/fuculose-1-phosphate aldolase
MMIQKEGYIKFEARWTLGPPLPDADIAEINHWRQHVFELGFIGAYPDGIGFGNISRRWDAAGRFLISGSATGHLDALDARHYCLVHSVEPEQNLVCCEGPVIASSESMSHAVIYRHCPEVGAVVHAHHRALWERWMHRLPTTGAGVSYGSPEMAAEIVRLLRETELRHSGVFITAGHEEGIFAFGRNLAEAVQRLGQLK